MGSTRLGAIALIVPEYESAIRFFTAAGFTLTADLDQGRKRWVTVEPPGGGCRLVLARADTPDQKAAIGAQGAGRVWLFLETDDFAATAARLTAAGAIFEESPRHEPYGIVAIWRDPFGNRWDLIQPAP
ncbi:extradiol dioxygenase [Tabrizicola sp. TH137]|uniref:VOC family protein n=1 Tax=Tabrizicola sp. TH137 TaxID=2067452 RepID=UPI000C7CDDD6|nr:VOC family protein [Tabrizicola sp. TH137]PLL13494.1 extradiol dioxygenase [Tabrizicola sp. TH137]